MRLYLQTALALLLSLACLTNARAQDELEQEVDKMEEEKTDYVLGAFKATRVINLQSVEKKAPGALEFRIAHRFGSLNGGAYQMWGLDQATMRMGLDYGITDYLMVGIGRSTFRKTLDAFVKVNLLQQSTGKRNMPLSVLYFGSVARNGLKWSDPNRINYYSSRLAYAHQLIIGAKASERLSWQLSPTMVHKNMVESTAEQNTSYALGTAARYKITRRTALTAEYIYRIPPGTITSNYSNYYNSLSLGVDIETGGHVFQLHLSNSLPMVESAFITETNKSWSDGGIHFGFNITRDFTLKKAKAKK